MHCDLIETDGLEDQSKKYGVNRLSILDKIPHFNLCICLPHDIMHIILEGVLPRHTKFLLQYCILEKKFFTLNQFNRAVDNFPYGINQKNNKPRPLDRDKLTGDGDKLSQSG